jgi:hypothetical protein
MTGNGIDGTCMPFYRLNPQNCYQLTVSDPKWIPDVANPDPQKQPLGSPTKLGRSVEQSLGLIIGALLADYSFPDTIDNAVTLGNGTQKNDGSTMFDTPTFADQIRVDPSNPNVAKVSHWEFHGKDFVLSGCDVVATVDWTLEHFAPGYNPQNPALKDYVPQTNVGYSGVYTSVTITDWSPPLPALPDSFTKVLADYNIDSVSAQGCKSQAETSQP